MLKDPFGDVLKKIMDEIHNHAELKPLCEPGTQNYEQWVVQKEQNGESFTKTFRYIEVYWVIRNLEISGKAMESITILKAAYKFP